MKIAIGPCLFDWGKKAIRQFYQRMAFETDAEILYIGEVVCSKRYHLTPEELGELADLLKPSGKEVVLSTLGLVMSEGEQVALRQIAQQARQRGLWLEANDMGGMGIGEGQPLVAGPHINTYNAETVHFLGKIGVKRVVLPVELSQPAMQAILASTAAERPQMELFAFGRLPLTFSARCYTARAFQLSKSNCQFKCGEFPDGMVIRTQEDQQYLTVNGTQTLSARTYNLIQEVPQLRQMGVDILRLSPQSQHMEACVAIWKRYLDGHVAVDEALAGLQEHNGGEPFCNGYFHGRPGLEFVVP
ncbi:MAG: U32 family peptidase [Magnetococcales bacterium]|nr:U32 family peptidase [Magnetococcales bacterium]